MKGTRYFIKTAFAFLLLFNVLALLWVMIYAYVPIPVTKLMLMERQQKEIRYDWKDLEHLSSRLQLAVMCAEDQTFLLHHGIDFDAIESATEANKSGKKKRGASTITQQVAKNVFLWPDRTWIRKGAELYFALLIEMIWSKERIMEVYLNVAEFGDGIFGAEAACQTYFNKPAAKLTLTQAASLAAILPSPKRYSAVKPSRYVSGRIEWIKKQMWYWGNEMTYEKDFVKDMIQ